MSAALKSGKVELAPLGANEAGELATLANDKAIWDNLRDYFPHPYQRAHAVEFIAEVSKAEPRLVLAIRYQNSLAGIIGLNPQSDVYCKSMEIGYWLGRPFWGRGIATEAVGLMNSYAFENFDCNRLFTGVFAYNIPSMRVLEKCGYQQEGIAQQAIWKNQRFWNEHRYALLKDS